MLNYLYSLFLEYPYSCISLGIGILLFLALLIWVIDEVMTVRVHLSWESHALQMEEDIRTRYGQMKLGMVATFFLVLGVALLFV
jgi:hypothetical protein